MRLLGAAEEEMVIGINVGAGEPLPKSGGRPVITSRWNVNVTPCGTMIVPGCDNEEWNSLSSE